MPQTPDGVSTRVSAPLTNVSVAYAQSNNWLAERVFPSVPVTRQGDLFWKYNRGDWQRTIAEKRGPGSESAGGGWRVSTDSYFADVWAVHKDLDDQTIQNASNDFNLESDATKWVTNQLMLRRDAEWISNFWKASFWGTGSNDASPDWTAGTDPIADIRAYKLAMREATGIMPNTLVLGAQVYYNLLDNASIIDRIKYSERGVYGNDLLESVLDVKIVIADSVAAASSGNLTATATDESTLGFMANKLSALLCYAAPRAGLQEASAGYIFSWTGLLGAGALGGRIKRFRMEEIESVRIEGEMAFAMKAVAKDLGRFIVST